MISFWHLSLLGAGSGRSLPWGGSAGSFAAPGTASSLSPMRTSPCRTPGHGTVRSGLPSPCAAGSSLKGQVQPRLQLQAELLVSLLRPC